MGTLGLFCEADNPKTWKMTAGVWGYCKGKRPSPLPKKKYFFCLKHAKMTILNKMKIQYKYHSNHFVITLKYIGAMLKLHFLQLFYEINHA